MTAKLIASILFLILILEIFPNRSAAIGSGPNESCKSGSPVCKQKILKAHLEDKKVHSHNAIQTPGDRTPLQSLLFKADKRVFVRSSKTFLHQHSR